MKRAALVCSVLQAFFASQAYAWASDGHMRLADLMQLAYGNYAYLTPRCMHVRTQPSGARYWSEESCIRIGSNDPDRYRKRGELVEDRRRELSHYVEGNARFHAAFCGAVRAALQGGTLESFRNETHVPPNNAVAMASFRLGTAFHYLQDMGDPSKDMIFSPEFRPRVRHQQEALLVRAIGAWQATWGQVAQWDAWAQRYDRMALLPALDAVRDQYGRELQKVRESRGRVSDQYVTQAVDYWVGLSTLATLAAQRQILAIFNAHVANRQLCDPRTDAQVAPELPSPSQPAQPSTPAPRPPVLPSDDPFGDLRRR